MRRAFQTAVVGTVARSTRRHCGTQSIPKSPSINNGVECLKVLGGVTAICGAAFAGMGGAVGALDFASNVLNLQTTPIDTGNPFIDFGATVGLLVPVAGIGFVAGVIVGGVFVATCPVSVPVALSISRSRRQR
jgi:hypothetical protein